MKKIILLSSILSFASFSVLSQDSFTSSIGARYGSSDNADSYIISGSYYFSPVDTTKGPLAEAVFLNRANDLSVGYTRREVDGTPFSTNQVFIDGTYHVEDSSFFLNASVSKTNGSDSTGYGLGMGYYFSDDWTVTVSTSLDDDFDYAGLGIGTKKLLELGGDTYLSLSAGIGIPEEGDNNYSVGADYYFNSHISLRLQRSWIDSFSDGATSLYANWFVTSSVSLNVNYAKSEIDGFDDEIFGLGVNARF
jgi:hypothetical protein